MLYGRSIKILDAPFDFGRQFGNLEKAYSHLRGQCDMANIDSADRTATGITCRSVKFKPT